VGTVLLDGESAPDVYTRCRDYEGCLYASFSQALDTKTETLRGVVVSKLEEHRSGTYRGYIAMLAVAEEYRGKGLATALVRLSIDGMMDSGADEIVLETEVDNIASLKLYEKLGFLRSKRLHRYYLNGNSAFRLVLYLKDVRDELMRRAAETARDHLGVPGYG
jgi:ribosomal protein S18 acetylase RimI-like enzyme